MSVMDRLVDAQALYERERPEGALALLLIAVAATARKRYPHPQHGDRESFTRLLQDELETLSGSVANISFKNFNIHAANGEVTTLPTLLYRILRNTLIHEGRMPHEVRFVRDDQTVMVLGSNLTIFNEKLLQGLANVVLLARENADEAPAHNPYIEYRKEMGGTKILGCVLQAPINLTQVVRYSPDTFLRQEDSTATA